MKKILILLFVCFSINTFSQSKYETGMKKGLDDVKMVKTSEEMLSSSAFFERIANTEKDKWLPYYYAALYNHLAAWMDAKSDKDKVSLKTIELIEKAELIDANNSELFCLRQMVAVMQMTVDPMNRWMTYGQQGTKALENAKKADPNNPRIYFLEGQTIMNTPEQFGGGKVKAKPLFEKAVELYAKQSVPSELHPIWGKDDAEKSLKLCQ